MIGVLIKIAPRLIIVEIQLDRDCIVPYLIDVLCQVPISLDQFVNIALV